MKRKIYFLNSHSEYSGKSGMKASKLAVKSKYADDESCTSLNFREFPGTLIPEERNILITTNSELTRAALRSQRHGFCKKFARLNLTAQASGIRVNF